MARPRWPRPKLLLKTVIHAVLLVTCVQCEAQPDATKDLSDIVSLRDSVFNASGVSECLSANWATCLKVSLLDKVTRLLVLTRDKQLAKSTELMGGLVTLETTGELRDIAEEVEDVETWNRQESLDHAKEERLNELLSERLTTFFSDKALTLKFIPGLTLKVLPAKTAREFVRLQVQLSGENLQQVMARTMKMGGMMRSPWMLVGPMITLGLFPFMLANLKYMVMNAFMINNMALMMALRTTVNNFVFGEGEGDNIVYRNKGYSNEYKNKPIDDHHPVRYTVKPYNQINKYRKVYDSRPSAPHDGDHQTSSSQNAPTLTPSTSDAGVRDSPVKYIAHHDYFGQKRPSVSLVSRPRTPPRTPSRIPSRTPPRAPVAAQKPVGYIEHHDYFGPSPPVTADRYSFAGAPVSGAQKNSPTPKPVAASAVHGGLNERFQPSSVYFPEKFKKTQEQKPVSTFSLTNSPFAPMSQGTTFVAGANGNSLANKGVHHTTQGQANHQLLNEVIPPNHKHNGEVGGHYNHFAMESRVDKPARADIKAEAPSKAVAEGHGVNTVVDRDQDGWVAKGDHWPIIYQDPTTIHQETKAKNTEVGTVFPVYTGTVQGEPEAKHSVKVSSGIRFEDAAPARESNGVPEGYFGQGEVISVSPHEDPALGFQDSLDLSDENEFVNYPQGLVQIRPGRQVDRRVGVESLEPEATEGDGRGVHRTVASLGRDRDQEQSKFPEALWVFRE